MLDHVILPINMANYIICYALMKQRNILPILISKYLVGGFRVVDNVHIACFCILLYSTIIDKCIDSALVIVILCT